MKSRRDFKRDISWGIRQSLILTGIAFIPAGIAAYGRSSSELITLGLIFLLYLAFAAVAGILVGLCRPSLQRGAGAGFVGGILGATGFVCLIYFPAVGRLEPPIGLGVATAALGALTGAGLGWWMWFRAKRRLSYDERSDSQ
jgi:hypothetical protein